MGTKRIRKGQYVFLYVAYCTILIIGNAGCAVFQPVLNWNNLEEAGEFLELGNYESAMEMNERAGLKAYSFQLDDILYQKGLIFVHPRNPLRNYGQAEESFLKLVEEHPASALRGETKVWIALINEIESRERHIQDVKSEVSTLQDQLKEKDQELVTAQGRVKEKDRELVTVQDQLQELQGELMELKVQIERLKEIDLGIDDQKRHTSHYSEEVEK